MQVEININDEDKGLPGILYIGTINGDKTKAYFLSAAGWVAVGSGMIPAYSVVREGLQNARLQIDLSTVPDLMTDTQNIYVGYGALSVAAERSVQASITALEKAKEKLPGRTVKTVDPDMHRLALIQEDLTKKAKYQFVLSSSNFPVCPGSGN
ncbi:hypothetical protein ACFQAT_28810 [Undibacterium arcticum]|uniref:hypothetical protein n=1 Tax=Undibacterium arcticum TaxID=1762892 RepID=UPI003610E51D